MRTLFLTIIIFVFNSNAYTQTKTCQTKFLTYLVEKPDVKSDILVEVPKFEFVEIGEKESYFSIATYDGFTGYIQNVNLECENIEQKIVASTDIVPEVTKEKKVIVNEIDINELDIDYCVIVGANQGLFKKKIIIGVDYGQVQKLFKPHTIRNANGKKMIFNSMSGALNFMVKNGWQYVNSYAVTIGDSNVYHYLLKRIKEF